MDPVNVASGPGYVIEDHPGEGRTLVVTGPWTEQAERALHRVDVDAAWLNYARGYCEPDLSFVADWPIKRLLVLDRSITDLTPLSRLGQTLEDLSIQAAPGTTIDLTTLPRLRALAGAWDEVRDTLYAPEYLSRLVVFDYEPVDLDPLTVQPSLQKIQLKVARRLETLDGIARFPTLTTLKIATARPLHELNALSAADATLRELDLESCPDVYDIDALSALTELRYLGISDCGRIPSISAVGELLLLECLYAWGSTRVEDGDLSPLLRLSRLKEIRMRDRREYQPKLSEVKERLGCA
jgi:hypothetical protein